MDRNEEPDPNATMSWTPDFDAPASPPPQDAEQDSPEAPDDPQATVRFRPEWLQEKPSADE
ncbi:hypothetical protein F4561_005990 [Lipingzhangella halophila]|uniref:Uncharacterized protein n=1 Tax=Lipingzhangella halophila TaxID=1783352 RepID=A0A7W7RPA4_9ACTN|nr:hypothetical protein [Lipingzhangella halophila]MBB4935096.1 hypothetical protein [Lipingzhangella halophila]